MRRSVLVFLQHNLLAGTMPRGKNFALQRSVKICFRTAGNGFVPRWFIFWQKKRRRPTVCFLSAWAN
jgi:hypothetical protein